MAMKKPTIPQMIPRKGKELPPTKGKPPSPVPSMPSKKAPPKRNTKRNY